MSWPPPEKRALWHTLVALVTAAFWFAFVIGYDAPACRRAAPAEDDGSRER